MIETEQRRVPPWEVTGQRPEIPRDEVTELLLLLADARDYAGRGRRSLGYALLLRALVHGERSLQQGQPWAIEYLRLCRDAIDQYCAENDVDLGE